MGNYLELGKNNQTLEWRRHLLSEVMELQNIMYLVLEPTISSKKNIESTPAKSFKEHIRFEINKNKTNEVTIKLVDIDNPTNRNIFASFLIVSGTSYEPTTKPSIFSNNSIIVTLSNGFRGFIVVAEEKNQNVYILDSIIYIDPDLRGRPDSKEHAKIEKFLKNSKHPVFPQTKSKPGNWFNNWSEYSSNTLKAIYQNAVNQLKISETELLEYLREYPTGLTRITILSQCNILLPSDPRELIKVLNSDSFEKRLEEIWPSLSEALKLLPKSEDKLWAIKNSNNSHLIEAIKWAISQSRNNWQLALELIELKDRAIDLRNRLSIEHPYWQEINLLIYNINIALRENSTAKDFRFMLYALEQKISS
ncbi:MAG: hypothetical protein HY819_17070 [Acidobacteria bacterium]|nr:hypothetical protein [Acidobacteriota bacterium]